MVVCSGFVPLPLVTGETRRAILSLAWPPGEEISISWLRGQRRGDGLISASFQVWITSGPEADDPFLLVACRVVGTKPLRWELSSSRPSRAPEPRIDPRSLSYGAHPHVTQMQRAWVVVLFHSFFLLLSLPPALDLEDRSEDAHPCSKIMSRPILIWLPLLF